MKKGNRFLAFIMVLFPCVINADEGMWMLNFIEQQIMPDMQEMGLKLTAEQIYSINNSSIKDAIVVFDRGCTGEIVSDKGLLFTNHHCGYDQIQYHSTVEHNYLKEGFWAASQEEELPNPDITVKFLRRIEDITDQVIGNISGDMTGSERSARIREITDTIKLNAEQGKYNAIVKSFFEGNQYFLFVYEVYKDVRLVGAPPSSIGKFGDESDNWEWPRHTGDFSIFRVYTAPDGSPAEYSKDNIPLKPAYYLPLSIKGINEGDFTMVLGFSGRTDRYLTSFGIDEVVDVENSNRIKIRGERLKLLAEDMDSDPELSIKYATKYSQSSNYWKYSIGQNSRVRALSVKEEKQKEERRFTEWAGSDSLRNAVYGNLISRYEDVYRDRRKAQQNFDAITESFLIASEVIGFAIDFNYLVNLIISGGNEEDVKSEMEYLKTEVNTFFKDYNVATDKKVTRQMFRVYKTIVDPQRLPEVYKDIEKKYKGDIDKFVDDIFRKTIFTSKDKLMAFLEKPSPSALKKDKVFQVANIIFMKYYEEYLILEPYETELRELDRLYMKARMEMDPAGYRYPDANSTIRLSYGTIRKYSPRDAVHYDAFTTLKGVMEKEDPDDDEFIVPEKLKELYLRKDFGQYAEKDGSMPLCFITNNDITGGNSGSPVLNASGELIGLAFDGNWEAMSGDLKYEPALQRTICVDVRYVLFIIDKYAGASHLLDELKIIN